jgi:hypothetical protein
MMNLKDEILSVLREKGFISNDEIAYLSGDILIAENVISNQKRKLENVPRVLIEGPSPRILKG